MLDDNEPIGSNIVHMGTSNYDPRFKLMLKPIAQQFTHGIVWIKTEDRQMTPKDPPTGTSDYTMMNYNPQSSNVPVSSMRARYNLPQNFYDNYIKNEGNAKASYDIINFSKDNLNKALYSNNKTISIIFSDFPFPSNSKLEIPDSDE